MLPSGFTCSGISAGIKKIAGKKDLGLVYCEKDALLGAVYTRNQVASAHVIYCRENTPTDRFRSLIVNSGNANAATGLEGLSRNLRMAQSIADELDIDLNQVFTSSTGIIGHHLPIDKITQNAKRLIDSLGDNPQDFAAAIMTTDLRTKIVEEEITIKNKTYRIFGVAKGSGMIHPNMATMLAYILTDAPIVLPQIQKLTHYIAERSFNRISVDRDTSTNDSFFLISSNKTDQLTKADFTKIKKALVNTGISLAKQIAVDGEGANHLIECVVKGAKNKKIADVVSREVISSNLVKTAVHGKDPNWGRILMAIGNGLAETKGLNDTPTVSISIQGVMVLTMNEPRNFNEVELSNKMSEKTVYIEIDLHQGTQKATSWGCDLSREYIAINAEYST